MRCRIWSSDSWCALGHRPPSPEDVDAVGHGEQVSHPVAHEDHRRALLSGSRRISSSSGAPELTESAAVGLVQKDDLGLERGAPGQNRDGLPLPPDSAETGSWSDGTRISSRRSSACERRSVSRWSRNFSGRRR